jgi:hypothetical protein
VPLVVYRGGLYIGEVLSRSVSRFNRAVAELNGEEMEI